MRSIIYHPDIASAIATNVRSIPAASARVAWGVRPAARASTRYINLDCLNMAVRDRVVLVHVSHSPRLVDGDPPRFLELVAHPVRWRLLRELVYSDRAVWELTRLLGEQQSLVSYHLRQLRAEGLVSVRRSSADGRDNY